MRVTSTEGTFYTSVRILHLPVHLVLQATGTTGVLVPGSLGTSTRNDDAWGVYVSCKL